MAPVKSVDFLQKRIIEDLTTLRDHHKIPVLFHCEAGGDKNLTFGSELIVDWFKTKLPTPEIKDLLNDEILQLTDTDSAGQQAQRPNQGQLTSIRAEDHPKKLPQPIAVLKYNVLWSWLSKYLYFLSFIVIYYNLYFTF